MDKNYSLVDEIKLKRRELVGNGKLLVAEEKKGAKSRFKRKSELTFMKKAGIVKDQQERKSRIHGAIRKAVDHACPVEEHDEKYKSRSQYLRTMWSQQPTIAERNVDLADNMPIHPNLPSVLDSNHMQS